MIIVSLYVKNCMDELDLRIIALLRTNGTITNEEISSHVSVSVRTVIRRMKSLKACGVVSQEKVDHPRGWVNRWSVTIEQ
jgi:DNA-binding Lrp family transcriptional regulator